MVHPATLGRGWLWRRLGRRHALPALADAAAPGVAAAIGVVRLVRLLAGAPVGVDPAALGLLVWTFVVAVVLFALAHRTAYAGELALGGVAIHELGRGWLEFLRVPVPDPMGQAAAFAVAALAGLALVLGRRVFAPGRP